MAKETKAPKFNQSIEGGNFNAFVETGVVDRSGAMEIQANTNLLGEALSNVVPAWKGYELAKVERETEEVTEDYMNRRNSGSALPFSKATRDELQPVLQSHLGDITKLESAFSQGTMSKSEFTARMTAITKDASNRAPGFTADIVGHTKKIMELSGINEIVDADVEVAKTTAKQFQTYSKNVIDAAEGNGIPVDHSKAANRHYLDSVNEQNMKYSRNEQSRQLLENAAEGRAAVTEQQTQDFIQSEALPQAIDSTVKQFANGALDGMVGIKTDADYAQWKLNLSLAKDRIVSQYSRATGKYADNANVKENLKRMNENLDNTIKVVNAFGSKEDALKYLENSSKAKANIELTEFQTSLGMSQPEIDLMTKIVTSPDAITKFFGTGGGKSIGLIVNKLNEGVGRIFSKVVSTGETEGSVVIKEAMTGTPTKADQAIINNAPAMLEAEVEKATVQKGFAIQDENVNMLSDSTYKEAIDAYDGSARDASVRTLGKYTTKVLETLKSDMGDISSNLTALPNGQLAVSGNVNIEQANKYTSRLNKVIRAYSNVLGVSERQAAEEFVFPALFGGTDEDGGKVKKPASKTTTDSIGKDFQTNITRLEGSAEHIDTVGNPTTAFGVNRNAHGSAIDKFAEEKGVEASKLTNDDYLEISRTIMKKAIDDNRKNSPEFATLPKEQQFAVGAATYNTGGLWPNLTKAYSNYNKDPSPENLAKVVKGTRRLETIGGKKQRSNGLDNRAVKELMLSGVIDIDNPEHAALLDELLPLWTSNDVR